MGFERMFGLGAVLVLASCGWDDAHFRTDTVTVEAGDAHSRNSRIHAVDPLAGGGAGPTPGSDGVRAVEVFVAHRRGLIEPPESASEDAAE